MVCTSEIICLGEVCACAETVTLPLVANNTGFYSMYAEFNGIKLHKQVSVRVDEQIVVPNIFNENYTHVISFYYNGQLVNDTSYSLNVIYCIDSDNISPMPPSQEVNSIVLESIAGNTITDERISGQFVTGLIIDDISKNKGFTVSGDTITFTDGTTLSAGQIITIIFE